MTRTLTALLIALTIACFAFAQDPTAPRVVKEAADGKNEIVPGDTYEGSCDVANGTEVLTLVCETDTICDLEVTVPEKSQTYLMFENYNCFSEIGVNLKLTRARFKKGRHELRLRPQQAGDYKLTVTPWAEQPNFDIEPNGDTKQAQALAAGEKMHGTVSMPRGDRDYFAAEVKDGPLHIVFKRLVAANPKERPLQGSVALLSNNNKGYPEDRYTYRLDANAEEFHFFPVAKAGTVWFHVSLGNTWQGDEYEFWWEQFTPGLADTEIEAAHRALEAGEKWLRDQGPGGKEYEPNKEAMDAFTFMALLTGDAGKNDSKWLEETYVPRLEASLKLITGVRWQDEELYGHTRIYEHAILTLALAEAVAHGMETARAPCISAAKYLLAAQRSGTRPEAWGGAVPSTEDSHGGWRYMTNAVDMDISATGWCLVALTAVDAAGIKIKGLRDAATWALGAIRNCTDEFGFTYVPKSNGNGNVRSSIGALTMLLYGTGGGAFNLALADMDAHLPAGTQVDSGHASILYYSYYATRANYLRSGKIWEQWRTIMLRQLLWTHETEGSWRPLHSEGDLGRRFGTALSLMILRMCLNEVPKYLKHEAEGF